MSTAKAHGTLCHMALFLLGSEAMKRIPQGPTYHRTDDPRDDPGPRDTVVDRRRPYKARTGVGPLPGFYVTQRYAARRFRCDPMPPLVA